MNLVWFGAGVIGLLRLVVFMFLWLSALRTFDRLVVTEPYRPWVLETYLLGYWLLIGLPVLLLLGYLRLWLLRRGGDSKATARWRAGWTDLVLAPLLVAATALFHWKLAVLAGVVLLAGIGWSHATRHHERRPGLPVRGTAAALAMAGSAMLGLWPAMGLSISRGVAVAAIVFCIWLALLGLIRWYRPMEDARHFD